MVNQTIVYLTNESLILYQKTLEINFYSKLILMVLLIIYGIIIYKILKTMKIDSLWKKISSFFGKIYYISLIFTVPLFTGFLTPEIGFDFFVKYLFIFYGIISILILVIGFIFGGEKILNYFINAKLILEKEVKKK